MYQFKLSLNQTVYYVRRCGDSCTPQVVEGTVIQRTYSETVDGRGYNDTPTVMINYGILSEGRYDIVSTDNIFTTRSGAIFALEKAGH